jgi:hypothetical protein
VPEQLLDGADVVPVLEQVSREGMAERVWSDTFRDPRLPRCLGNRLLDDGFVKVETGRWPPSRVGTDP